VADRQLLKGKFMKNFDYTQAFSYSEIVIGVPRNRVNG